MCKVQMIRHELGLVSIPVEKAVYCEKVSNSAWRRCGVCGSEEIVELALLVAVGHPILVRLRLLPYRLLSESP